MISITSPAAQLQPANPKEIQEPPVKPQVTEPFLAQVHSHPSTTLNRAWTFVYDSGSSGPAPCCGADPTANTHATTDAKGDNVKYGYGAYGRPPPLTDANVQITTHKMLHIL